MSTPDLVQSFYDCIWNAGQIDAIPRLLARDFTFRGSLGDQIRGHEAFADYVRSVRGSLTNYRCNILDCVHEETRVFAKMRFSGLHSGVFRGCPPTGLPVWWDGAALFRFESGVIAELWVLGDLLGLDHLLRQNEATGR